MLTISEYAPSDWPEAWAMLEPVIRAAESYPCPVDMTEADARRFWTDGPRRVYMARDETGAAVGTFYIKPDQGGPGDHICNCGYIVAEGARGRGVAVEMCLASQKIAAEAGYLAMKFNLVVATNEAAVKAWKKCGLSTIGVIPQAFRHARHGLVDAFIMYRPL